MRLGDRTYAGIGSRHTPHDVRRAFIELGAFLARRGYGLRSGHAVGADQAFELGCDSARGKKEIWVPWSGFEMSGSNFIGDSREAFDIAKKFHPNWDALSLGAKKLHARNVHQILGLEFNDPCEFVVCWTKNGSGSGGTGQALRIAKAYNVPIFDFGNYPELSDAKREFNKFYGEITKKSPLN